MKAKTQASAVPELASVLETAVYVDDLDTAPYRAQGPVAVLPIALSAFWHDRSDYIDDQELAVAVGSVARALAKAGRCARGSRASSTG